MVVNFKCRGSGDVKTGCRLWVVAKRMVALAIKRNCVRSDDPPRSDCNAESGDGNGVTMRYYVAPATNLPGSSPRS